MKLHLPLGVVVVCFLAAGVAQAHVGSGGNCANCHSASTGRQSVNSALTTTAADAGMVAGRKKYLAHPGDTLAISATVTNGGSAGNQYAMAIRFTSATTVAGTLNASDLLTFTPDTVGWTARTASSTFYSTQGPLSWASSKTFTYNLAISPSTLADYYSLTFTATGVDSSMWTQAEPFYVQVTPVPEPATLAMLPLLGGAALLRRRRA